MVMCSKLETKTFVAIEGGAKLLLSYCMAEVLRKLTIMVQSSTT